MKRLVYFFIFLLFFSMSCKLFNPATSSTSNPTTVPAENLPAAENTPNTPTETLPTPENSPNTPSTAESSSTAGTGVLLFGIGMHIEPQGETHQGYKSGKGNYAEKPFFMRGVKDIQAVADIVAAHEGHLTIQAQSPFTDAVLANNSTILSDLASAGNEIALHFHEDAHLGKNSSSVDAETWCAVMKEEIELIRQASGVKQINYWSGGNIYPEISQAASCAGLSINSDWKDPKTQTTDPSILGIYPWRPTGGTNGKDFSQFTTHNPTGAIVFLPEGLYDRNDFASMRRSDNAGGDQEYFDYLKQALLESLATAEAGKVAVFHFTIHPGEFRGNAEHPFEVIDQFLTDVVDPLVKEGKIQWATYSQMASAYKEWEQNHPGQDMR